MNGPNVDINLIIALISSLVSTSLLWWVLKNPEKVEKWVAMIRALFAWILEKVVLPLKLWLLGRNIEKTINKAVQSINSETGQALFYRTKVKIQRVVKRPRDIQTVITDSTVEVIMDHDANTPKLIVQAILTTIEHTMITNLRHFLCNDLIMGIDLTVVNKVVKQTNKQGALAYFRQEVLTPKFAECPSTKSLYRNLVLLDERGWFTPIFLYTVNDLQRKVDLNLHPQYIDGEIRRFISFLRAIALKRRGARVPVDFISAHIKVKVLLVGTAITRLGGIGPYVARIKEALIKGAEIVYIIAVGQHSVETAKEVAQYDFKTVQCRFELKTYRSSVYGNRPALCALLVRA